jgi:glycosyltransferase involved in cell wall biosynthesis
MTELSLATKPLIGRKILIIVENLPVPFDRRVWQEAQTLARAGATVSIICPIGHDYRMKREVIDNINIYRHPLPSDAKSSFSYIVEYCIALVWQIVLAFRVLRKHGFDAIHGCNPPDLIFIVALIFRLAGKKFLFDHHDINPELYEAKFGRRDIFWKLLCITEKLTFKAAAVSLATNNSYHKIAIHRGGMRPENVFIVRSGPDLNRIREVPPNQNWRKNRSYLVGYVGVIGPQEGIDLLIHAAEIIIKQHGRRDVQFCIVGSGPSLAASKAHADTLGLADYVTFTGRVSDKLLLEILSTSDVCVNPDRVNEMNDKSTMNKILEYMALGKPIVQFDVTEGRYSAQDASLYAAANDPDDFARKIVALLDDPVKRQIMGEIGRERVRTKLSWEHEAPQLIAAYRKLFGLTTSEEFNVQ